MKSERYLLKKILKFGMFSVVSLIGMTFTTGFSYDHNVFYRMNDIKIELGEKLPEEITDYIMLVIDSSNLKIESDVPLDKDGNTVVVGEFEYHITYDDNFNKFTKLTDDTAKIIVEDTVAPIIKVKDDVTFDYNAKFEIDKVAECFDLSDCRIETEEEVDTTKSGTHDITIISTDESGNKSSSTVKITIKEKPVPVVTYNFYYSAGAQTMNNNMTAKNSLLTEEEKASLRQAVVNFAKQFVGNPYVYGGTSLTNGTDCSGFTMSVYANFGYALPRSSGDYFGIGVPAAGGPLPGDIVVYGGHVGIYAGGGMMVHAGTEATGIVYAPVYAGVITYRRIIY